jgi:hypothetical protein
MDGRTGEVTRIVSVRTHDVGFSRIDAPSSARVGQTKRITVELANARHPERVEVQLFRMQPAAGGNFYELVATQELPVPVKRLKAVASASFDYVIRPEDRDAAKLAFKAVARIVDHLDPLPGDNEVTSPIIAIKG